MNTYQKGFGLIGVLIIIVVVASLGFIGYKFNANKSESQIKNNSATQQSTTSKKTTQQENSTPIETTGEYLVIEELNIRIKLTENTKDAYYVIGKKPEGKPPVVILSVHSLDKFPACKATIENAGIASIQTFLPGETNPVHGDYQTTYPDAPSMDGYSYFIDGNHYDCTEQQASEIYKSARNDFIRSYAEISKSKE